MAGLSYRILLIVSAALIFLPTMQSPASATHIPGCSGTLIEHLPITSSGSTVGYLDVYYSTANGGTNCAKTVSSGASYGVPKFMLAKIYRCTGPAGSFCSEGAGGYDQVDQDRGTYRYYAGPVSVTYTSGRCISYAGLITWDGVENAAGSSPRATHCG